MSQLLMTAVLFLMISVFPSDSGKSLVKTLHHVLLIHTRSNMNISRMYTPEHETIELSYHSDMKD